MPTLTTWDDLNEEMKAKAEKYLQELHYEKKQPINLFAEEKAKLLSLPNEPFEIYRLEASVLDKYGRVGFEGQKCPVVKGSPNESVLLKIHWDEVEVLGQNYERLGAFSRPYSFKEQEIDWIAELKIILEKPKTATYAWIYSQLPQSIQSGAYDQLSRGVWPYEQYSIDSGML